MRILRITATVAALSIGLALLGRALFLERVSAALRTQLESAEDTEAALLEFFGPPIPDGENAVPVLERLSAWMDAARPHPEQPEALAEEPWEWDAAASSEVATYLASLEPFFEGITEALARPGFSLPIRRALSIGETIVPDFTIRGAVRANRLLTASAWLALSNPDSSDRDLERGALHLAQALTYAAKVDTTCLITHLVRCSAIVRVTSIVQELLERDAVDARWLRDRIAPALEESGESTLFARCLRGERAWFTVNMDGMLPEIEAATGLRAWIQRPFIVNSMRRYIEDMGTAIVICDAPYAEARAGIDRMLAEAPKPKRGLMALAFPSGWAISIAPLFSGYEASVEAVAQTRLARLALDALASERPGDVFEHTTIVDPRTELPFGRTENEDGSLTLLPALHPEAGARGNRTWTLPQVGR